jgi:hypothetical protein
MTMVGRCESSNLNENPAAQLGAILGELAKAGRDKVTFVTSDKIASFADWVEQLIAESTGKDGRGIVPVVGEPLGPPEVYRNDRLFVYLQLAGDTAYDAGLLALESAEQPVVRVRLLGSYDVGGHMFLWEMAVAIAGRIIGINPFDQPNVEMSKVLARQMVADYVKTGKLWSEKKMLESEGISVYGSIQANTPSEAFIQFLKQAKQSTYLGLQAYVNPTTETDVALRRLRVLLRHRTKLATTLGYGPSFLHSTGQLHKGDAGHGLFLQFTSEHEHDVPIPNEVGSKSTISFGTLEAAQALGDYQSLVGSGRMIIRFHFNRNVANGLNYLSDALE